MIMSVEHEQGYSEFPPGTNVDLEPYPPSAFPIEGEEPPFVSVPPPSPTPPAPVVATIRESGTPADERELLKASLLSLAAGSCRGEAASAADVATARSLAFQLEAINPTSQPTLTAGCIGTWELAFSDTQACC